MAEKKPFDPVAYKNQFNAENYDRINLTIRKGEKARLQAHADSKGESLNAFIKRAITEQIKRDNEPISEETWDCLKDLYKMGKGIDQCTAEDEEEIRAAVLKYFK